VTKGKPWSREEETKLRDLLSTREPVSSIAKALGKTKGSIYAKIDEMGIVLKEEETPARKGLASSSNLKLPRQLPSIEKAMKRLVRALNELEKPGLDIVEVQRLRGIIQGVKIYKDIFADYVDYRAIEDMLLDLRQKYEQLVQKTTKKA
jgi:hypothetical protein